MNSFPQKQDTNTAGANRRGLSHRVDDRNANVSDDLGSSLALPMMYWSPAAPQRGRDDGARAMDILDIIDSAIAVASSSELMNDVSRNESASTSHAPQ